MLDLDKLAAELTLDKAIDDAKYWLMKADTDSDPTGAALCSIAFSLYVIAEAQKNRLESETW